MSAEERVKLMNETKAKAMLLNLVNRLAEWCLCANDCWHVSDNNLRCPCFDKCKDNGMSCEERWLEFGRVIGE